MAENSSFVEKIPVIGKIVGEISDLEYTASADQIDALKLNSSALSPEKAAEVYSFAGELKQKISSTFKEDIPEKKLTDPIENRIIILDRQQFDAFFSEWMLEGKSLPDELPGGIKRPDAVFVKRGRFIAIVQPKEIDAWGTLNKNEQRYFARNEGGLKHAATAVNQKYFNVSLVHEMLHSLQDNKLPLAFLEGGARFLQHAVFPEDQIIEGFNRSYDMYSSISGKYGQSNTNRLFFGSELDRRLKTTMLNEINSHPITRYFSRH